MITQKDSLDKVHNRICLITSNVSGSILMLYIIWFPKYRKKYDIKLLKEYDKEEDYYFNMITCNMTVGTYGPIAHNKEKISLELWHGFPLKGLGDMIKSQETPDDFTREQWRHIDKVVSILNYIMC